MYNFLTIDAEGLTSVDILSAVSDVASDIAEKKPSEILAQIKTWAVDFLTTTGVDLIVAALILIIGWKVVNYFVKRIAGEKTKLKFDPSVRGFLKSLINIGGKVIVLITAATVLGLPMTSVITVIGSCGLALGLALQGSLSNIAGGFIVLVFKPFVVGDYITCGAIAGTVREIGIFYTKVNTVDNKLIIIPNSQISNQSVENLSKRTYRRVDLTVCVGYESDIETVKSVLSDVCRSHAKVVCDDERDVFVRMSEMADSTLKFTVRAWCKNADYWDVYFDLTEQCKTALDKAGIDIPYPQLDVHLDK